MKANKSQTKPQTSESLESYKRKVADYLRNELHGSTKWVSELMTAYENDFPDFLADGWDVPTAVTAMTYGY